MTTELIPVEEARGRVLAAVPVLAAETAPVLDVRGQALAADVVSEDAIPPFDNSAMDGYAVRAADVAAASADRPIALRVIEHLPAGSVPGRELGLGDAARIMTGAMMPGGADAVAMVEITDGGLDTVRIREPVPPGEHVRRRGESVAAGEVVFVRGTTIGPSEMAMLAALGMTEVEVIRRPRVAILSTGDELGPAASKPGPGKIRDSNRYGLQGQVAEVGAIPIDLGLVADDAGELRTLIARGLAEGDCVVTSGGVSVGDYDLTRRVLAEFGNVQSWRVAMKPGMPQAFGLVDGKPLFGVPGNPVSSLIVFDQVVRPALLKMAGHTRLVRPRLRATAAEPLTKPAGKVHFLRAIIENREGMLYARTTGPQGSGILKSLARANGLIILEREVTRVAAGETVIVELLDPSAP